MSPVLYIKIKKYLFNHSILISWLLFVLLTTYENPAAFIHNFPSGPGNH
jgi:hypothetical protein